LTHFTQYVPGHAHLALLFFSASVVMGGIFYIIPRIYKVRIYSRTLVNVQYSLYVIGFVFFFAGFLLTGLTQGAAWLHQGLPVWSVLPGLRPYMALRAMGGALVVISFSLFAYNILATIIKRQPVSEPNLEQLQPIPAE
jgi:cbb3-type cytochrome oxidase subunit 1